MKRRIPAGFLCLLLLAGASASGGEIEVLRDRWGVPHLYAQNRDDLFYAQGWVTAKDRLFQIDLWRRAGTGHLAEALGPSAVARDRIARLVRFRGSWKAEWAGYGPDSYAIAKAFTGGINAYIQSLKKRPLEFEVAGYDPGLWAPEDITARVAGLLMCRNLVSEVQRAIDIREFGLELVQRRVPPDPLIPILVPAGLDLRLITDRILQDYREAIAAPQLPGEQGSNNWVVDGTMSVTGKPILANDPHRPVLIPSLRKTVHLVAPGWNVIGAGEPALPGVALGHNQNVAWGFTIVGTDQQDLYVETLNPERPGEYRDRGRWRRMEVERTRIRVKGETNPREVELHYTLHGPVGAGYLPALRLMQVKNWSEFRSAVSHYQVPSENLVYADRSGNIGWIAAGSAPIRTKGSGLLPVPGESGEYAWSGYLHVNDLPQVYNPPRHFVATANHKTFGPEYTRPISYEWALPFRAHRIEAVLQSRAKWDVAGFEQLQQDVLSLPALRFREVVRRSGLATRAARMILEWDGRLAADSEAAMLYEFWLSKAMLEPGNLETTLEALERDPRSLPEVVDWPHRPWVGERAHAEAGASGEKKRLGQGADRAARRCQHRERRRRHRLSPGDWRVLPPDYRLGGLGPLGNDQRAGGVGKPGQPAL
ncbi:MAG: penicillin acylase family protein [Acidobacteria bacterium]|nr:penicillin acylase family protein [Acidobacteriota bacterium]